MYFRNFLIITMMHIKGYKGSNTYMNTHIITSVLSKLTHVNLNNARFLEIRQKYLSNLKISESDYYKNVVKLEKEYFDNLNKLQKKIDYNFSTLHNKFYQHNVTIFRESNENAVALEQAYRKNVAFYRIVIEKAIAHIRQNTWKNNTAIKKIINAPNNTKVFSEEELNLLLAQLKSKRIAFLRNDFSKKKAKLKKETIDSGILSSKNYLHNLSVQEKSLSKDITEIREKCDKEKKNLKKKYVKELTEIIKRKHQYTAHLGTVFIDDVFNLENEIIKANNILKQRILGNRYYLKNANYTKTKQNDLKTITIKIHEFK